MGMTASFLSISNEKLIELKRNPAEIEHLAFCFAGENSSAANVCDVDKSWQTIHFLLAGDPWIGNSIEAQAVLGGTEIGEDMGYGPARFLTPEQVQDVSKALNKISREVLANRFDAETMERADLYAFSSEYAMDELEMAQDYFENLKSFYATSAEQNEAVLLFII